MMEISLPLNEKDLELLQGALHYLHMSELKMACASLKLPFQGQKGEIIQCIMTFLRTGEVIKSPPLPEVSKAKNMLSTLSPKSLILSGSYKNDLPTRTFLKTLVGDHFHFTAFGQDWIKNRWRNGNPPTYAEFASFWEKEYEQRKTRKATPKKEWAYINFLQQYGQKNPSFSKQHFLKEWERYRTQQVQIAQIILEKVTQ
jgi:hypothetical protein